MAFEYKLQRVLDIRKLEEDQTRFRYFKEEEKAQKLKKEISFLQKKQDEIFQYLRKKNKSVEDNIRGRNYLHLQRKKINNQKAKLDLQEGKINKILQKLLERKKRTEMMEKLKKKAKRKYHEEFFLNEQKRLDEISLNFNKNLRL